MRVVVITGSRDWTETAPIEQALVGADALVVGCCPRGADYIALMTALRDDVMVFILAAGKDRADELRRELKRLGKVATVIQATEQTIRVNRANGPLRNQGIVDLAVEFRDKVEAQVDCYAYPLPGSKGTNNCRSLLVKAGFRVTLPAPPAQEVLW